MDNDNESNTLMKSSKLRRSTKDRYLVLGDTTMYYSNSGSVHVMTPIPGSPSPGSEPGSGHSRPHSAKAPTKKFEIEVQRDEPKDGKKRKSGQRNKNKKANKNTITLPPLKCIPRGSSGNAQNIFPASSKDENQLEANTWIHTPGFKPSEPKSTPKKSYASIKLPDIHSKSIAELIEATTKQAQDCPTLPSRKASTPPDNIYHLPPIVGAAAARPSQAHHINVHKDNCQLPPISGSKDRRRLPSVKTAKSSDKISSSARRW